MKTRIPVHITYPPADLSLNLLRSQIDPIFTITTGELINNPVSLQYLVSGRPKESQIKDCPNLRAVIIPFAGIPAETRELMRDFPGISVHNLHHNAVPVAENTIALLLAAAKHIIPPHNALAGHDWRPRYGDNPSILLDGRTALILGYGHIGSRLAKILLAFGMHVMTIRNSIDFPTTDGHVRLYPSGMLHQVLPRADVLINTLPLTQKTEGLIGETEFALLPRGAVAVNIGRGKVFDQGAFFHALLNGHLSAAAIDVWYNYPEDEESREATPPSNFPFHTLPNVVLSPHRAGGLNSQATETLRMQHLARLLNHAARGENLPNLVDLQQGY